MNRAKRLFLTPKRANNAHFWQFSCTKICHLHIETPAYLPFRFPNPPASGPRHPTPEGRAATPCCRGWGPARRPRPPSARSDCVRGPSLPDPPSPQPPFPVLGLPDLFVDKPELGVSGRPGMPSNGFVGILDMGGTGVGAMAPPPPRTAQPVAAF